jgi:hypothetical protein
MNTKARCSKRVWSKWDAYQCGRGASIERDGKPYCGTHDPVKVEERQKKKEAKWQGKIAADRIAHNKKAAVEAATAAILQVAYEMREQDKRLSRAFTMLMGNSDWQPPAKSANTEDKGK